MTEEVQGGRLHLDAYIDTAGMTRGAQRRIDAEVRKADLKAQIRTELSTRGTIKQAKEAAAKASQAAKVKVQTVVNQSALVAQIKEACVAASAAAVVHIRTDVDTTAAAADIAALQRDRTTTIETEADTAEAEAEIDTVARDRTSRINLNVDQKQIAALMGLSKVGLIAGGVQMLTSAVTGLAGGLYSMGSAAVSSVSVLAVIPNLAGVAVQAIAPLLIGFSGIGEGVAFLAAQEQQAAQKVGQAAQDQKAHADAIRSAEQAVHNARDSLRLANAAVEDSEYALAQAHDAVREAQEALTQAREDARQKIADLNRELRLSAGDEAAALDALKTAREDLQDVRWDKASSDQERRAAERAVAQAERDYKDTKMRRADLRKQAQEANREGVKGSEEVQSAQQGVADAVHAEQEAQQALAESRHSAADAAKALKDAQRGLTEAQNEGKTSTDDMTSSLFKQQQAWDKLSPAGQRFARFLYGLKDRWYELRNAVQGALLPPVQRGIQKALPLLDTLQTGLVNSARRMGGFVERLGTLFGRKTFNNDVAGIMRTNNKALGIFLDAAMNLIHVFKDVAKVVGPVLLVPFAKWVRQLTAGWRETAKVTSANGKMADFFERAKRRAALLKDILGNLWTVLKNIGKIANPAGESLLKSFEKVTRGWGKWTASKEGQKKMQEWFAVAKSVTKQVGKFVSAVADLFATLGKNGGGPLIGLLKALTGIVKALDWLVSLPGIGPAISWILTLAGAAGGLGMVAGFMLTMGKNVGTLIGIFRSLGSALIWVGRMAYGALGPWGVAILLVVGLFILLYKKVDWFRAAVDWVVGKVRDAFFWLVDGAKKLWDKLFGHSIFPDIVKGLKFFAKMAKYYLLLVTLPMRTLVKVAIWLWKHGIQPALENIWEALKTLWKIAKPIWANMVEGAKIVGKWIRDLYDKYVKPKVTAIHEAFTRMWDKVRPVLEFLRDWVKTKLVEAFRTGVNNIKTLWGKIKDIASSPVEFIVNTVYNEGIRRVINAIPGVDNLDPISVNWARGTSAVLPGYTPGRDPHSFMSADGKMRLNLSGGEGIIRPEVVRALGPKAIDYINAAARKGGNALREALGMPMDHSRATGGIVPKVKRTLSYWLGGVMPLPGATSIKQHDPREYDFATWAGDLNWPGTTDYGKPIVAWKGGSAHPFDYGSDTSYGRGQVIDHGGSSTLYAHMSRVITSLAGKMVSAGQKIGYVGDYGNTGSPPTSHLHFEIRGGSVNLGDATVHGDADSGPTRKQKAEYHEDKEHWWDIIGTVKDFVGQVPKWFDRLRNMGGMGSTLLDGVKSLGGKVRNWVNDKLPNKVKIPLFPDIDLPDNPIPNIFDRGGKWLTNTVGVNMSGRTETVFTNENIVDITHDLAVLARGLSSMVTTPAAAGGAMGPLVGELTLVGTRDERRDMWAEVDHKLRVIRMGGVHVRRPH